MARSDPQVNLRMPQTLKDQLEAAAASTGRSLTAEIVSRLEASLQRSQGIPQEVMLLELELQRAIAEAGRFAREVSHARNSMALSRLRADSPSVSDEDKARARDRFAMFERHIEIARQRHAAATKHIAHLASRRDAELTRNGLDPAVAAVFRQSAAQLELELGDYFPDDPEE